MEFVVYKDGYCGQLRIHAGIVLSKGKGCKIRHLESGMFNGYKNLLYKENIIAYFEAESEERAKPIFDMIAKAEELNEKAIKECRNIAKNTKDEILGICKEIEIKINN